jgi:hypothetical protein
MSECRLLTIVQPINLSHSKLSLLQRVASNNINGKCKLEEEAESSTARKRLRFSDDNIDHDNSSDSPEEEEEKEEMEEEVSLEETSSMNQLDTSREKLLAMRLALARSIWPSEFQNVAQTGLRGAGKVIARDLSGRSAMH